MVDEDGEGLEEEEGDAKPGAGKGKGKKKGRAGKVRRLLLLACGGEARGRPWR